MKTILRMILMALMVWWILEEATAKPSNFAGIQRSPVYGKEKLEYGTWIDVYGDTIKTQETREFNKRYREKYPQADLQGVWD